VNIFIISDCQADGHHLVYIKLSALLSHHVSTFSTACKPVSKCFLIVFQILSYYVLLCSEQIIQMDDDSCAMNYIKIVPLDSNAEQPEDVKPFQVKVCVLTNLIA